MDSSWHIPHVKLHYPIVSFRIQFPGHPERKE